MQNELGPKGLVLVGLSTESAEVVSDFSKRMGINYALGAQSWTSGDYGVFGIPYGVLLDREGRVAWQGRSTGDAWVEKARALLQN